MNAVPEGLPRRRLAPGVTVSALGMGCARLGAFWQGRSPADGRDAVAAAREAGIEVFDTADCYARGISERVLGRALHGERDAVVLCTKVGLLKTPAAHIAAARAGASPRATQCYAARYVRWAAERSLRRLRTDRLDILLLHNPSVRDLDGGAAWVALEELRDAGAILRFGVSCEDVATARAAVRLPGIACLEVPWNPDRREILDAISGEARDRGIAILANRPFGDRDIAREAAECLDAALAVDEIAVVLVGMSRRRHVTANVAAAAASVHPGRHRQ